MNRYDIKSILGSGSYGTVFSAVVKSNSKLVAIKRMPLEDGCIPQHALREMACLKQLHHPNIVPTFDIFIEQSNIYIVLEHAQSDLRKYMKYYSTDAEASKRVLYQILSAIAYMHERGLVHRDLKPSNILLGHQGKILLADFGLGRRIAIPTSTYTSEIVTLWYRPPEVLLGEGHYTPAVDIWSVGCIMAELLTGQPLLKGDCELGQLFLIFRLFGTPTEDSWPGLSSLKHYRRAMPKFVSSVNSFTNQHFDDCEKDLFMRMMTCCPAHRITARQALEHPWFSEIHRKY